MEATTKNANYFTKCGFLMFSIQFRYICHKSNTTKKNAVYIHSENFDIDL